MVSLLSWIYRRYRQVTLTRSLMSSLRPVVVALIASAGVSILRETLFGSAEVLLQNTDLCAVICFVGAFFLIRKVKWNPIGTMVLCGGIYTLFTVAFAG